MIKNIVIFVIVSNISAGCIKITRTKNGDQIVYSLKREAAIVASQVKGSRAKFALAWNAETSKCLNRHYGVNDKENIGKIAPGTRLMLSKIEVTRGCSLFFGGCDVYTRPLFAVAGSNYLVDGTDLYCNGRLNLELVEN